MDWAGGGRGAAASLFGRGRQETPMELIDYCVVECDWPSQLDL